MSQAEEFSRSVEDGLKLSKRIFTGSKEQPRPYAAGFAPPRHLDPMERSAESFLPTGPMVYASIVDPGMVDNPDIPSYQPYVYGRCDPPALIPVQMKEMDLEVECVLDTAFVTVRGKWWVHCVTRSRACDCRFVVPMGEQGSILGVEIEVAKRSYSTEVIETEDERLDKVSKIEGGGFVKPQLFSLTIPEVNGGSDIFITMKWSQKLLYAEGRFSVHIPFNFPSFVNPFGNLFSKREKIRLTVNSGTGKEVLLQGTSHSLKEKGRHGGRLTFVYDEAIENWSTKDFNFTYSVYSADLFGGILLQSPSVHDYDQRDLFCLFLLPGNNQNKKIFRKEVVFVVDTSLSMRRKPLESVKNSICASLYELTNGDYFNIIAFNDEISSFSTCLVPATEEMIESANQWMGTNFIAKGGTEISRPLNEAMSFLDKTRDSIPHIFLITDGSVEDERNICSSMKSQIGNKKSISLRISTFGIGSYCNHYFLRMLASIGRGHYDAAFDPDSIENRMKAWFKRSSSTILTNFTIDAFDQLDDFEMYPQNIPDISSGCVTCVSGRYRGKLPDSVKAKGLLADKRETVIDLKVQNTKDMHLEKVFGKQNIDFLTAEAWFSENKQLEKKITKLSIQNSITSEYTNMIMLETNLEKTGTAKQAKKKHPLKLNGTTEERIPALIQGLTLGFGNLTATKDNVPTGFGEPKPPEALDVMFNKAVGCCSNVADCFCCMCLIRACSKLNDQCFIVVTQLCTALACLGCVECCSEFCCNGSNS